MLVTYQNWVSVIVYWRLEWLSGLWNCTYVFTFFFKIQKHDFLCFLSCCTRFYRAMLYIRSTSHWPVSVSLCVSVSLSVSVTSRSSTKTAKRRITQTTPHDTPGSLVFSCQRSPHNSTGVTPYEGAECRWGGQNRRLSTNSRLYLENGTR